MGKRLRGLAVASLLLGCSAPHIGCSTPPPSIEPSPQPPSILEDGWLEPASNSAKPGGNAQAKPWKHLAFALEEDLYLWDAAAQEVLLLDGALAGLSPAKGKGLHPRVFAEGKKVLFSFGNKAFFWDLKSEERTTPITDGRAPELGGPQAVVTPDGKWIAYVSGRGTLVLKRADGTGISKTIELTKIAAEAAALCETGDGAGFVWDLDMTADASCLILNIDGTAYLYDVKHAQLQLVGPLDGEVLGGNGNGLAQVAVSPSGRYAAVSLVTGRVLLIGVKSQQLDTVPYANLAGERIVDMLFLSDEALIIETERAGTYRVWCYEPTTELLRDLAILNQGGDVKIN